MPTIVIQHVACVWTKRSRGGEGARQRNSVPTAVDLPEFKGDLPYLLHTVNFFESGWSKPNHSVKSSTEFSDLHLNDLILIHESDSVTVRFMRDGANAACPNPYPHKDVFSLRRGDWGRIVYNGRYVDFDSGAWRYKLTTYNIGNFDRFSTDVFRLTSPSSQFEELARLI